MPAITKNKTSVIKIAKKYVGKKVGSFIYTPKESDLCKLFFHEVKSLQAYKYFKKDFFICHIANEHISSPQYRAHLQRMGLVAGVADYMLLLPGGKVAFIEFKRDERGKQSRWQLEFSETCLNLDVPYFLTWDKGDAIKWIEKLLED